MFTGTGERTARMLMTVVVDMVELAFNKGSHVNRQDYSLVQKNKESLLYEGPDGSRRLLGCFPGSVRVSIAYFLVLLSQRVIGQLFCLLFSKCIWAQCTIHEVSLLLLQRCR